MPSSQEQPAELVAARGSTALLVRASLAFLALTWLVAAVTFARDTLGALRNGAYGDAVEIELPGLDPAHAAAVRVERVSPRGNRDAMVLMPGTSTWTSVHAWYAGASIAAPAGAPLPARAIVRIAGRASEHALPQAVDAGAGARIALALQPAPRPSALSAFAGIANWPGDAAVLRRVLTSPWGLALALASAVLLFVAARLRQDEARAEVWDRHVLRGTLAVVLGVVTLYCVPAFVSRAFFPLTVEHLEGVQIATLWNWLAGEPLYGAPTWTASGNIYTPGYYLLARGWAGLFGLTLPSLRALTWLLQLVMYASALHLAWRLSGDRLGGVLWLPIQLLAFCAIAWIDNANKDAAHTALALVGVSFLVEATRAPRGRDLALAALAGSLWGLAFMVKQSHAPIVAAGVLGVALLSRRLVLPLASGAALVAAGASYAAWRTWGDAYLDWTLAIPREHRLLWANLLRADLLFSAAPWLWIPVAAAVLLRAPGRERSAPGASAPDRALELVFVIVCGAAFTGLLSIGKDRGGPYALLPALSLLAIGVSIGLRLLPGSGVGWLSLLLLYPLPFLPAFGIGERERVAADRLVEIVRAEPGPVWVPFHPWTSVVAGKPALVPMFCVGEWLAAGRPVPEAVLEGLRQQRAGLVITDFNLPESPQYSYDDEPWATLQRFYAPVGSIPAEDAFRDRDGWQNVPRILWRPRPPTSDPPAS